MKIKVPKYNITLAVRINGELELHKHCTTAMRSMQCAKKFFSDPNHWEQGWEDVKVVSIDRDGFDVFDVPTNELVNMIANYKEENDNGNC